MNKAVSDLLGNSLAPSTLATYKNAMRHYKQFHDTYHLGHKMLPISTKRLAQFIAVCHHKGLKPSSISTILSAISYIHQLHGYRNPTQAFIVKQLLHSVKKSSIADTRLPVTLPILEQLLSSLKRIISDKFTRYMLRTMFVVAFFGLFRIGEISQTVTDPQHTVLRQNVTLHCNSASILLTTYKHSQGQPARILLKKQDNSKICPVRHLEKYLARSTHKQGPLFQHKCNCPVQSIFFNTVLKKCVKRAGLDPKRYKPHSFRIGGATHAHLLGYSTSQIQALGRWKSSAFHKYIRISAL